MSQKIDTLQTKRSLAFKKLGLLLLAWAVVGIISSLLLF
jgi:hypothetical protein